MTQKRILGLLALIALVLLGLTAIGASALFHGDHPHVTWVMLVEVPFYAAAGWLVHRHGESFDVITARKALFLVVGFAALMRAMLLFAPPLSTDIYRYIWDGRVQSAGINPYRYLPADEKLMSLRDSVIFPEINRADTAPTIYPPMAQLIFAAVTRLGEHVTVMKAAMVAFEALILVALLSLLQSQGLSRLRVLFYAWHPLTLFEFAGSGHIDAAAIALMMGALVMAGRRRPLSAGVLLACATCVKFFPAVIAPALYRKWDWRFPVAAAVAAFLLYLPYIGVGTKVLGFLPSYVQQEKLEARGGFAVIDAMRFLHPLPAWATSAYLLFGLAIVALIGIAMVFRRPTKAQSVTSAMLLLTAFTLVLSPQLPWYYTWIVPFLCFRPSPALIVLTGGAPLLYDMVGHVGPELANATLYVPFLLMAFLETWNVRAPSPALETLNDRRTFAQNDRGRPASLS
jgi:hypothetical protein